MRPLLFFLLLPLLTPARAGVIVEYTYYVQEPQEGVDYTQFLPTGKVIAFEGDWLMEKNLEAYDTRQRFQLYHLPERVRYWCSTNEGVRVALHGPMDELPAARLIMGEEKTIAGLPCRRAVYVQGNDTLSVYYTDVFGIEFCRVARVPGLAMEYETVVEGVGRITMQADRYRPAELEPDMFDLSGYEVIRQKEPKKPKEPKKKAKPTAPGESAIPPSKEKLISIGMRIFVKDEQSTVCLQFR